jgi:hypothetical protein
MTATAAFSPEEYRRYRQKVRRCLDVFAAMLHDYPFDDDKRMLGLELEVDIVDADGAPAMRNAEFLVHHDDPLIKEELGLFNLEFNAVPRLISGAGFLDYERELDRRLAAAQATAERLGARLVMIGTLPTIRPEQTTAAVTSAPTRYHQLNQYVMSSRADEARLDIRGTERLRREFDSIMAESANTSFQVHLQTTPASFANYWNASQAIACAQVAVGANSPFLFGARLWDETRIALFHQIVDPRASELKNQGVRPRVWFGERWITSIFDLFEENVRYFGPMLPLCDDEQPEEVLASGGVPALNELRLHNGTIYRWNRPVYDISGGIPHLRVENRVLPAGPTVVDMLANAAFYAGVTRAFAEADRPIWSQLPYEVAVSNFLAASQSGLEASVTWPNLGEINVLELVLRVLMPAAHEGLAALGVDGVTRDRLLGIIEHRCVSGRTGAFWQTDTVARLQERGLDRWAALRAMLARYIEFASTSEPVHTWPLLDSP